MVFNGIFVGIICIIVLWLMLVSIVCYRLYKRNVFLTDSGKKIHSLDEILDFIDNRLKLHGKNISVCEKNIEEVVQKLHYPIQNVGLIRFNPFSDTGGSQSFTIALLDDEKNGILITSLYARSGNRFYVKNIKSGHGVGIELSKEEQMAVQSAKHVSGNT